MNEFKRGLIKGLPIGLGYLSVSFAFGIMGRIEGLTVWQVVAISMLNLTSAGQLAGLGIMVHPGQYLSMFISQLTINVRYSFMSVSLSQKLSSKFDGLSRMIAGFAITDEIFGVAVTEKEITRRFFLGLATIPYIGWALGTFLGAILGDVLPASLMSALGIALYAMFVAIVVPEMKESRTVSLVAIIAIALSTCFTYAPVLSSISSGIRISICAIAAAVIGAIVKPVKEVETDGQ